MQDSKKIARTAMIGERISVTRALNKALEGIRGEVTDETRNTIKVKTTKGIKTLIKDQATIRTEKETIEGPQLAGRPEERIKR